MSGNAQHGSNILICTVSLLNIRTSLFPVQQEISWASWTEERIRKTARREGEHRRKVLAARETGMKKALLESNPACR
jgi:hypothetical protein